MHSLEKVPNICSKGEEVQFTRPSVLSSKFVIMALLSLKAISLLYRGGDNWPTSCDIGALRVDQADVEADLVHISWRGGWSWVERGR